MPARKKFLPLGKRLLKLRRERKLTLKNLANATGLKVQIVDDPLSSVARGTSVYLENLELWKDTMDHNEYGWE